MTHPARDTTIRRTKLTHLPLISAFMERKASFATIARTINLFHPTSAAAVGGPTTGTRGGPHIGSGTVSVSNPRVAVNDHSLIMIQCGDL